MSIYSLIDLGRICSKLLFRQFIFRVEKAKEVGSKSVFSLKIRFLWSHQIFCAKIRFSSQKSDFCLEIPFLNKNRLIRLEKYTRDSNFERKKRFCGIILLKTSKNIRFYRNRIKLWNFPSIELFAEDSDFRLIFGEFN